MKYFILVLLLVLIGCNARPTMKYVTNEEYVNGFMLDALMLQKIMKDNFEDCETIYTTDIHYILVDAHWFLNDFRNYYKRLLESRNMKFDRKFDCDDFADFCMLELQLCHLQSNSEAQAPMIARFHYVDSETDEGQVLHAIIVLALRTEDGRIGLLFFDPQLGEAVKLDGKQIFSVFYMCF